MTKAKSKLEFIVGLIDQITGPAKNVMKTIDSINKHTTKGFNDMKTGALAMAGTGYAIYQTIAPAVEMDRALGEIKSLDVLPAELQKLEKAGDQCAMKFGKDAVSFVKSAYDIQSAIGGLVDGELAKFTYGGNVLAKATKADAATITNYMGTMYGIFEKQAASMGKGEWVEQLTGMTATAVKMFKTTGQGMSDAFKNIGSTGKTLGISMSEQMGVLGMLQKTMPGAEAGTKYRAFLDKVVGAQKGLGLQFVDSEGKLLPMVQILEKINGKYGDLLKKEDAGVLAKFNKAFGGVESVGVVTNLIDKTDSLSKSIDKLGNIKGMKEAEKMALDQTDTYMKLSATIQVITKNVMKFSMQAITPLAEKLQSNIVWLNSMIDKYPVLGKIIGYVTSMILGITAALAIYKLSMGAVQLSIAAFKTLQLVTSGAVLGIVKLAKVTKIMTAVQWLLNAAFWANPITWVIAGVLALTAGIAALFYWYEDIEKALQNSVWGIVLLGIIDAVLAPFRILWDVAKAFFALVTGNWDSFTWGETIQSIINSVGKGFEWLMNIGQMLKEKLFGIFGGIIGKITAITDKLNIIGKVKGWFGFGEKKTEEVIKITETPANTPADKYIPQQSFYRPRGRGGIGAIDAQKKLNIPAGGVSNTVNNNSTTNYGGVTINSQQPMSPAMLEEWQLMQGAY